jgi:hypothetical protein
MKMLVRIILGRVLRIIENNQQIQIVELDVNGEKFQGINYPELTGRVEENDLVHLNATAIELGLGTGGFHFITAILNKNLNNSLAKGHIMKLRYTPQQIKVLAVEEEESPYHQIIKEFKTLNNKPVIIGFLHSMVLPCIAGIRAINPHLKISYIMSDGGALPLPFSRNIKMLQELNWLQGTITAGHAFGGDLEAINIYSALAAAAEVQKADIIIVAMGPGIVGTGTQLGTTALEVGQIINAVGSLGGRPIVIPRINFNDSRQRHKGLSHHTLTVLEKIALIGATVVLPSLNDVHKMNYLKEQIEVSQIRSKHQVVVANGEPGLEILKKHNIFVQTMGRSLKEEEEFFLTACATGVFTANLI